MSLSKYRYGDDYIREYNIRPHQPKSGYTAALGDLVVRDTTLSDAVDYAAAGEIPLGFVVSINSSNGTISVAEFYGGVTIVLPHDDSLDAIGNKVSAVGSRSTTIYPTRDRVKKDNSGGGYVLAYTTVAGVGSSPAGAGTCVVQWIS